MHRVGSWSWSRLGPIGSVVVEAGRLGRAEPTACCLHLGPLEGSTEAAHRTNPHTAAYRLACVVENAVDWMNRQVNLFAFSYVRLRAKHIAKYTHAKPDAKRWERETDAHESSTKPASLDCLITNLPTSVFRSV